jgi:hypothetical protein
MTTKQDSKGQRIVRVTPELLQDIFVNGAKFETNIPDDARLLSFHRSDTSRWEFWFKFESSEWDELMEGDKIPFLDVHIEKEGNEREYFLNQDRFKYE